MNYFSYKKDDLYCEDLSVAYIAEQIGTPFYLYSYSTITRHFQVFNNAFKGRALSGSKSRDCA
jgi:diaminopimelate decarboxylase